MITIKKSPTADTRSATGPVTKETLLESSVQHIRDVQRCLSFMQQKLAYISMEHDHTKLSGIDPFVKDFNDVKEGREKDFRTLPWYQRHITEERHHIDQKVPDKVNLFDLLERIADASMAGLARTGKVFPENIPDSVLREAYNNTLDLIVANTKVED